MQNNPLVSIIIPTFNRAHLIVETLDSVLAQTYSNWECIVVDDGSTDGTREMLEAFPQVIYHYQSNAGVCTARNKGAEIATGDWLIFLDSDDELLPSALADFSKAIGEKPSASILLGGYYLKKNGMKISFFN